METIELELDENGSPVTLEAAAWYVCFVPGLKKQWWHRFVNERHKHVFAMRPAARGEWTLPNRQESSCSGARAATYCMYASSFPDTAAKCAAG